MIERPRGPRSPVKESQNLASIAAGVLVERGGRGHAAAMRPPGWLLLLFLATSASPAAAAQVTAPAPGAAVQRFATAEFLPYIDARAPEGGYYPALIRRVLAHHGVQAEFVDRPWARASLETARGGFDGSFPYLRSAAREREFLFSDPLLVVPSYLFARRADAGQDPQRLLLESRRTCYLRDSLLPPAIEARIALGQLEVVRVDDMAQCFRMLESGRIAYVAAGIYNARSTLAAMNGRDRPIVPVGAPLDNSSLHLVWPKVDPRSAQRREAFNASLHALDRAGELERLRRRLLPAD